MGIIDDYMAQVAKEKEEKLSNLNIEETTGELDDILNDIDEDIEAEIERLRRDPNDMMNAFYNEYPKVTEEELVKGNYIKDEEVKPMVRRVYCPKCGKELVSNSPLLLNPYTGERIAKHECECGYKANLDYAYPRICFVDNNNNEVIAYSR